MFNLQEPFQVILPTEFTKNYLPITLIITLVFKSSFTQCKIKHKNFIFHFSSVTQSCPTLCDPMDHSMPSLPVHHQLTEFTQLMSMESVMPSNYLILGHPLLLPHSIFSRIRVFSNESARSIRWPKYWSFSFRIS